MSSILTNNSASIALQTLKAINSEMSTVQAEISTGKKVARPGDNSAVWAIAKTMEADVAGFKTISDNLNLGNSTVAVARQGAETITDLLTDMKGKIVAAQEDNVDRSKIQADIEALTTQINDIAKAAQFNGENLLQNQSTDAGSGSINIMASLDRSSTGVTTTTMNVKKQDLSTNASTVAASGGTYAADAATATLNATQTATIDASSLVAEAGAAFSISVFGTDANDSSFTQANYRSTAAATETQAEMAAGDLTYVAAEGDTMADVVNALGKKWQAFAHSNDHTSDELALTFSGSTISLSSNVTTGSDTIQVAINRLDADAGNTIGGGLEALSSLDVSTASGADDALGQIEGLIQVAVEASAAFGSDQGRIETQSNFIGKLTDSLKSGIGALTDANMEESSAKLQALQVQQQLAVQALSIANQSPSTLLALFR
ncbi:Flagellin [Pelagimonas phthalicica]|uniref:Flagellin n=1 Tax=Pelagimonas phthalicica TaxID=1037362 RepID=A0A238JEA6_9RHOB|nr:flagellin [Pelagimonas phthalicica]TDS91919.1 flagellin [Pelagimonas phthalicica]SMX28969.1 Flagellin [Pelagimonas phthalicica]